MPLLPMVINNDQWLIHRLFFFGGEVVGMAPVYGLLVFSVAPGYPQLIQSRMPEISGPYAGPESTA